jgi:DNA-binding transcriptional LysR family regulator
MNQVNDVELRHLEHFVAVAEDHSFTRAASRVHLVQSALSVSIRSLEKELGAQLFERTTHRVELTDAGSVLLTEARRTLAAADAARDAVAVAAVHGGLRGTVRIGIMHSLSLIDLAALLTTYHRDRPRVQLVPTAAQGGSAELVREVIDGRLDLAFAALPSEYPAAISVRRLAAEEMVLACPPDHPLARRKRIGLSELDGERFVEFPPGWGTRLAVDRLFQNAGLRREIAVEVADISNVLDLVNAGFGLAFLGPSTVADLHRAALRRVRPAPEFTVSLITSSERTPSAAARALVDLVTATFPGSARVPRPQPRTATTAK